MGLTLVTLFAEESRQQLNRFLKKAGEPVCKIPYGRVELEKREELDTLPPHFTVSAWKSSEKETVCKRMSELMFRNVTLSVDGMRIVPGAQESWVLHLSIAPNRDLKKLQENVFSILPNPKYHPDFFVFHLTVCIDRDREKMERIQSRLQEGFRPFSLTVSALGLFEIYPAELLLKITENGIEWEE